MALQEVWLSSHLYTQSLLHKKSTLHGERPYQSLVLEPLEQGLAASPKEGG
jgi:hypothetical protein